MAKRTCSVVGCGKPHAARGWCKKHYTRWVRTGTVESANPCRRFPENLLSQLEPQPNGCIYFTGYIDADGYGSLSRFGVTTGAHRAAYEHFVGPIPEGLAIDHECHNRDLSCAGGPTCLHRRCVNVAHVHPVPPGVNSLSSVTATASSNKAKTHCVHGHEFTEENTYRAPKKPNARGCRICRSAASERQALRRASSLAP